MRKLSLPLFHHGHCYGMTSYSIFPYRTIESWEKNCIDEIRWPRPHLTALFAARPEDPRLPIRGRITQADKDRSGCIYPGAESQYSLAFTATFQKRGEPQIEDQRGAALPRLVEQRFAARRAAIAAVPKFMTESYNFEVLDAPDGKGYLVYALASTKVANEIIVGGHYRISVSPSGKVQQVDALSRSFPRPGATPRCRGLSMSHIVQRYARRDARIRQPSPQDPPLRGYLRYTLFGASAAARSPKWMIRNSE
jgi:hypothetical protein